MSGAEAGGGPAVVGVVRADREGAHRPAWISFSEEKVVERVMGTLKDRTRPVGRFPYEPGITGAAAYRLPHDALPSRGEKAMMRRRQLFCVRCRTATLGPWRIFTSVHLLRVHMRECQYPFSVHPSVRP